MPNQRGEIVDVNGKSVGEHIGLMYYTLGQRRGWGSEELPKDKADGLWSKKDLENNKLIVSHGDESVLLSNSLLASSMNWIPDCPSESFTCTAKFRYRQPEQKVDVKVLTDGRISVNFHENNAP